MKNRAITLSIAMLSAAIIVACGGGATSDAPTTTSGSAAATAVSIGAISAFGSVFVNGHEFATDHALVFDDDAGTTGPSTAALEVGMVVDVKAAATSTAAHPVADELHLHPLARGVVDAADLTASTLTVMGQTIQVSAATLFSDQRSCLVAATNPCAAVAGLSGLDATSGSGAAAIAGSFVTVHGYLFGGSGGANIVATLIAVADAAAANTTTRYKAEGQVNAIGLTTITVGELQVDLSHATCRVKGAVAACASAYSVGQVVSVYGTTAPALPALHFSADGARLNSPLLVQTVGASVEVEGRVASVSTTPAAFVIRGIAVDASALPAGSALPAIGDTVEVQGAIGADGKTVVASTLKLLGQAAHGQRYGLEGDATVVSALSAADTFSVSVLGQTITVNARTRLSDRNLGHGGASAFNIKTFQTHLAASASQHLVVQASADASGALTALALAIAPISSHARLAGPIATSPAPVNGLGSATTFSVHGVAVSADPAAITRPRGTVTTVSAGDDVIVVGTYSAGVLLVGAPSSTTGHRRNDADQVIDLGIHDGHDSGCF
jgi:hypothetical protein